MLCNCYFSEKIELWLSSISSFARADAIDKVSVPPILIVGSHLDCVQVSTNVYGY